MTWQLFHHRYLRARITEGYVVICCCMLLYVVVCCCMLLYVVVCCYMLLCVVICCCTLLYIVARCSMLLCIGVCCCTLLYVVIQCCFGFLLQYSLTLNFLTCCCCKNTSSCTLSITTVTIFEHIQITPNQVKLGNSVNVIIQVIKPRVCEYTC